MPMQQRHISHRPLSTLAQLLLKFNNLRPKLKIYSTIIKSLRHVKKRFKRGDRRRARVTIDA